MIIRPGRPFWSGFTALFSSMVSLIGVDQLSITDVDVQVSLLGALLVSLLVGGAVYGQGKVSEVRTGNRPDEPKDPPPTLPRRGR